MTEPIRGQYKDLIQIDQATGPSSSGVVVVKMGGEVIGYCKDGKTLIITDREAGERIKQTMGDGHKAGAILQAVDLSRKGSSRQFDGMISVLTKGMGNPKPVIQARKHRQPRPNELCLCGSKKKFKHCCRGKETK